MVGNLHFIVYAFHGRGIIKAVSTSGWYAVNKVELDRKTTLSGLTVYTPKTGDQCWDSPLPSTPYFNDRLKLINSENISSGFTVTK
jgi:hypothetical protein